MAPLTEPAKSISLSKCPVFPTSVISLNFFMWLKVMILVEETTMSILRHDGLDLDTNREHEKSIST